MTSLWLIVMGAVTLASLKVLKDEEGRLAVSVLSLGGMIVGLFVR